VGVKQRGGRREDSVERCFEIIRALGALVDCQKMKRRIKKEQRIRGRFFRGTTSRRQLERRHFQREGGLTGLRGNKGGDPQRRKGLGEKKKDFVGKTAPWLGEKKKKKEIPSQGEGNYDKRRGRANCRLRKKRELVEDQARFRSGEGS